MKPDLIILGQVTIDDVVPAVPGAWRRQMGGSSLYAVAGARHWIEPERIGLAACVGRGYPFDAAAVLRRAGVRHVALRPVSAEHLVEWLIYEEDGSRRSLPRNTGLRDVGAEGSAVARSYTDRLLAISPPADAIPPEWLPAKALHLCPQVGSRHRDSLAALAKDIGWISVDPSPHYSRTMDAAALAAELSRAAALLPSEQEVETVLSAFDPDTAARQLAESFSEVVIKRGPDSAIVASGDLLARVPTRAVAAVDPTGAGDSFCGAYAACRLLGMPPIEAARRAAISAALVVGCSGVEAALATKPA
jgi:ribokinase